MEQSAAGLRLNFQRGYAIVRQFAEKMLSIEKQRRGSNKIKGDREAPGFGLVMYLRQRVMRLNK
jgi:hypothetical protein